MNFVQFPRGIGSVSTIPSGNDVRVDEAIPQTPGVRVSFVPTVSPFPEIHGALGSGNHPIVQIVFDGAGVNQHTLVRDGHDGDLAGGYLNG